MRKTINIITLLILLCGCTIYCFRLESFDASNSEADASYDANISKEIEDLLSNGSLLQDVISANHSANSDAILNDPSDVGVVVINEVFDNFFKVYELASANHNNAKNVEMVASTGSVSAIGTFNGLSVTITGQPYLRVQRNANGELYLKAKISKMKIPYLPSAEMDNTYYFSGSKYYVNQFYDQKVYSQRGFVEAYSYSISDLISVINEKTVTVNSFSYDEYAERYTAKITFNVDGNGNILGLDDYTDFIIKATDNSRTGSAGVTVTQRSVTFIINKNCQLVAMASSEHWSGSVYWADYNLSIKPEVDLTLLWTFNYPKKLKIQTYTF